MKKYILMDLDGTVTDSAEGIFNSIEYALGKMGIEEKRENMYRFLGPPISEEMQAAYGISKEESGKALEYYREYFADRGLLENTVYDGIIDLFEELKSRGRKIILATAKPEVYSNRILKHFDLMKYFDFVSGATMDETRIHKDEIIAYALKECKIKKEEALMVGDRKNDVHGAIKNGIDVVGVLYGYGSRKELEEAGAEKLAKSPMEILNFI